MDTNVQIIKVDGFAYAVDGNAPIVDGDWFYNKEWQNGLGGNIFKCNKHPIGGKEIKIVASTDPHLIDDGIPCISNASITNLSAMMEKECVEFAEWLHTNSWNPLLHMGGWYANTAQLYTEYQRSKTKGE